MEFILFAISAIAWLWLRNRVQELKEDGVQSASVYRNEIATLTRRVYALEQLASSPPHVTGPPPAAAPTPPALKAQPVVPVPPPRDEPIFTAPPDALLPRTESVSTEPPAVLAPQTEAVFTGAPARAPAFNSQSVEPAPPSRFTSFREALAGREWESMVGGSLLNAIGAIVLVIGIALFLAYSFAHMTAAGRASLAAIASVSILGAGVWVERKPRYRIFARGLIGAGWAALYATSYAIYAIPAARILPNAVAGSLILLAVALGMVAHSLRYRSQAVTLIAYSAVFASLAVTPSSPFAVTSLIPIAASVLYLAARFEWDSLPLFGLIATYLTCISRGESNASLASTQALFLAYWLLFEIFDLRRVKLGRISGGLEFLFPLNAAGFLGLSYLTWSHHSPDRLWFASACAAALFLASSIARAFLQARRAAVSSDELIEFFHRLRRGSFGASLIVSALLAVMAIVGRVPGIWTAAGLALEAEVLYLAGVRFDSRFVRALGTTLFGYSLGRLAFTTPPEGKVLILEHAYSDWTPAVVFHAALFYLNRAIRGSAAYFSYAASALVAIALFAETPHSSLGFAWVAFGCALLELGLLRRLAEFRIQSYCLLAAGVFAACAYPVANPHAPWWPLAATLALVYACAVQARHIPAFAGWLSFATSVAAAILLWRTVPLEYVAVSWMALALALFELGVLRLPSQLRFALGPLTLLAATGVMATHPLIKYPDTAAGLTYLGMCLGAWAAAAQLTLRPPSGARDWEARALRDGLVAVGMSAALTVTWMFAPDPAVGIVWTAMAIALLEASARRREASFDLLSLATLAAAYARILSWDFADFHQWAGVSECALPVTLAIAATYWMWRRFDLSPNFRDARNLTRLLLWAPPLLAFAGVVTHVAIVNVALWIASLTLAREIAGQIRNLADLKWQARILAFIACAWGCLSDVDPAVLSISIPTSVLLYATYFVARRGIEERAPLYFSLLGTVLGAAILYGRVSGGLLTVAWGLLGLSLLGSGFVARERILRLQGLSLFLVCVLKLFLYDLRNLETVYRILSFVALGLILLSVSWIYSRFREQIERLL